MNVLEYILNKTILLQICLTKEGIERVDWLVVKRSTGEVIEVQNGVVLADILKKKVRWPVVIVISGNGVIQKTYKMDQELMAKITTGGEFFWNKREQGGKEIELAFVRKDRVEKLLTWIEEVKLPVISIQVGGGATDLLPEEEVDRYIDSLKWKMLIEDNLFAKRWCSLLTGRLKYPVLIGLLFVLLTCFLINNRLQERCNTQLLLLSDRQKNREEKQKHALNVTALFQRYQVLPDYPFAVWSDQIAALVPVQVNLIEMAMIPVVKPPEKEKQIQVFQRVVRLKGESPDSEPITLFLQRLSELSFLSSVKLMVLSRKQEAEGFNFELELLL